MGAEHRTVIDCELTEKALCILAREEIDHVEFHRYTGNLLMVYKLATFWRAAMPRLSDEVAFVTGLSDDVAAIVKKINKGGVPARTRLLLQGGSVFESPREQSTPHLEGWHDNVQTQMLFHLEKVQTALASVGNALGAECSNRGPRKKTERAELIDAAIAEIRRQKIGMPKNLARPIALDVLHACGMDRAIKK